jgi:drug/metabolite transporter (DMT)-like permease
VAAFAYLVVFGSWLGFGAYAWLLPRVSPAKLATYAYVNPLIALGLGAAVLHEPVTPRTALSAAVILLAVAVVQGARH